MVLSLGMKEEIEIKKTGIRTHAIIALSAALIMVVSKYGFPDVVEYDAARMAAQIVSGVGFFRSRGYIRKTWNSFWF